MRKKRSLTLLEVAEFLGVKEATAQRYESGGIKNVKHETICKLAELFDCDPRYLMGWTENNTGTYQSTITATLIVPAAKEEEPELSDQTVELLRLFDSMSMKGRTLLLSRAYELEEKYGSCE